MKKIITYFAVAAFAVAAFSSCSDDSDVFEELDAKKEQVTDEEAEKKEKPGGS